MLDGGWVWIFKMTLEGHSYDSLWEVAMETEKIHKPQDLWIAIHGMQIKMGYITIRLK